MIAVGILAAVINNLKRPIKPIALLRLLPHLKQMAFIHGFHLRNLRGDIYGGLTAAVVALPLALAFGVASGVGPIAGLYGAVFVGFFAALLGGTPSQISGPTGPMAVVMAVIFLDYVTSRNSLLPSS